VLDSVLPRVMEFEPEMVFYLSGVDALASDVLGRLALTPEGLEARDRRVIGIVIVTVAAGDHAGRRIFEAD